MHSLPRVAVEASDLESILVKPDAPALVADGNLDFRFFFNGQVSRYGPIVQAESGAAARGPASSQQLEVNRGLPARLLIKHSKKEGQDWQLNDPIKRMVRFDELNLIGRWPPMGTFDIVFIRNVLIYFDAVTRRRFWRASTTCLRRTGSSSWARLRPR